ncbi:MAG: ParA family protein [Oscillospiraceae bacterium]|nr:ParA family protein [Oscillospiraceae bacterium]
MRTTAIFSYKGGTGKTTTAINLGAELAARGKRVLLIDADGQRNTTAFFAVDAEFCGTVYDLLTAPDSYYENYIRETIVPNLSVLPSSEALATIELQASLGNRSYLYTHALQDLCEALAGDDAADFVLIDCPPSFAPQTLAALLAADDVVVPLTLDDFAVSGLRDVNTSVNGAREANPRLRIAGVLVTMFDHSAVSRDADAALRASGFPVYGQTIRASKLPSRMSFERRPLRGFAGWSPIARDYAKFCEEYLGGDGNG